ncbi:GNAT family N-acetyltransferase [Caldibacillus lycopersici]|uniref:GNAT family N-acetyltransferase n=1 Tax=Perspicuibacillus lycopersici TaxID=1325689 RepID=A0AAE3IU85_9BACI|nr:GNAT family N-acetyltransferase [Perspicuibacillus lycopersici]MCU9614596.1 GNAT family N-acetyltransferase [Perspicuibacillus lycopersici]
MKIIKLVSAELAPMELLLTADPARERIEEYLDKGECYVLQKDAEVIGTYVLLQTSASTIELMNLAVHENYQGKGLGKNLIKDAILRAKQAGYQTLEVGTGNSSFGQLALYQKCGFRIIGVDQNFFLRNYDEPIMENGIWCRDMIRLSQTL